ncbi:MAG: phage/plasmid primase, P4 family [Reyranellaceae bacterium]
MSADPAERLLDLDSDTPEFSDDDLALSFAALHFGLLRHVSSWGAWMHYDAGRWQQERTRYAFDQARRVCRWAAASTTDNRLAISLTSAKTIAAVERLAQSDRRMAATADMWDVDPMLLNTPGGVVHLKTGFMRPHDPADFLTRITAVAPDAKAAAPSWANFLRRVTGDDAALIGYLKRLGGYMLTGRTDEQILAFAYGTGANGKSVFINTVAGILGDYARSAPIETFTESAGERHPTELAMLRGARLVSAIETEQGRRWAESRIKALTGGDKVAARFMRQDFFEYVPQFKLLIAGNHKPSLRSVDEAIRRRLHLIPFAVTIPPAERDPTLAGKLQAEWPAILAWMIEGCIEWQCDGLKVPPAVQAATAQYIEAEDAFGQWLGECVQRRETAYETTADLFASWKAWADRAGEHPGSLKRFSQTMTDRGVEAKRQAGSGKNGFQGVRLIRADYTEDPRYGG